MYDASETQIQNSYMSMSLDNAGRKTIALIEYHWMGHHAVWFRLFTKVLVERGYKVVGFCPEPSEMEKWAGETLSPDAQGSCEFTYRGVRELPSWVPAKARRRATSAVQYLSLARALKRWEKVEGDTIDLVFFACIYDFAFEYFNDIARFFRFPVSGLYLHCRSIRMPDSPIPQTGQLPSLEKFWGREPFRSLAVLDEGVMAEMNKLGNGRSAVWMPDVATATLPKRAGEGISSKLGRYAMGQPIILLAGHIQPTKGADLFCEVADRLLGDKLIFAVIGEVAWSLFPSVSRNNLCRVAEENGNVFAHFARVSDEADINACINGSDVIFAAYQNFPNSSNMLSKAAQFRKPIIVSDGYLMAERVRKFRLGIVIPEGDANAAAEAVCKLSSDPDRWCRETNPDWDGFLAEHSETRLSEAFEELVEHCLNPTGRSTKL